MHRTSSYTIYVDLPDNREDMLLVHGYTGAYDKVSRRVATWLRSLDARRAPKPLSGDWTPEPAVDGQVPSPSDLTVEVLKKRGYLTELPPEEEEQLFEQIAGKLHERHLQAMPNYIFMPTYNCNLRCSYCFQDHMRTDPRFRHLLRTIQPEIIDRIFAAMPEIEALHGVQGEGPRHRRIGFFGGEPLLAACRPAVEQIMQKALALGTATFWAVTNGTELEAYDDLLGPQGLSQLQITLDGPPAEHDQRRIYADGSGSFERIAANINRALGRNVLVSIRLNVDRHNIGQLAELSDEILARGWDKDPRFSVYTAPIRKENDNTAAESTFDTWELDQALSELIEDNPRMGVIGRPDDAIRSQARRIFREAGAVIPSFQESYCSAHTRMYIFDPFADIYACWDRTGDPDVRIGRVAEDGNVEFNVPVNALWRGRTVASNPVCRRCRYALYCGGGCAVLALGRTGRFHSNFCDGFASRFRSSVAESWIGHIRGAEVREAAGRVCDQ